MLTVMFIQSSKSFHALIIDASTHCSTCRHTDCLATLLASCCSMLCVDPTMEQSTDAAPAASAAGTLERLIKQWPGREQHITQMYEHLSAHTARRPLVIHGGAATGKSALVRCCPACCNHLPPATTAVSGTVWSCVGEHHIILHAEARAVPQELAAGAAPASCIRECNGDGQTKSNHAVHPRPTEGQTSLPWPVMTNCTGEQKCRNVTNSVYEVRRVKHGSGPMDMQLRRGARGWMHSRRPSKVRLHGPS